MVPRNIRSVNRKEDDKLQQLAASEAGIQYKQNFDEEILLAAVKSDQGKAFVNIPTPVLSHRGPNKSSLAKDF